jgi:hypothetical protein
MHELAILHSVLVARVPQQIHSGGEKEVVTVIC